MVTSSTKRANRVITKFNLTGVSANGIQGTIEEAWERVVFAAELPLCVDCGDEPFCTVHEMHYSECPCPGPQCEDDGWQMRVINGVLMARRRDN